MRNQENLGNDKDFKKDIKGVERNPSYAQPDEESSFSDSEDTLDADDTSFDASADEERTEVSPGKLGNNTEINLGRSGVNNYSGSKTSNTKNNQSLSGANGSNSRTNNADISKNAVNQSKTDLSTKH
jgi:hypothetical protein